MRFVIAALVLIGMACGPVFDEEDDRPYCDTDLDCKQYDIQGIGYFECDTDAHRCELHDG